MSQNIMNTDKFIIRKRLTIEGYVQGVGFRPFVHHLANKFRLSGHVLNLLQGVDIEVEGESERVARFEVELVEHLPPLAQIGRMDSMAVPPLGTEKFIIEESSPTGENRALILPDFDVCPDCLRELFDPADRRYRYPFINCVNCGPRYSLVTGIPYDRVNTTMSEFEMCAECRAEFENPDDRRFHAQPIACPKCGPQVELLDEHFDHLGCGDPIREVGIRLKAGWIVAIKGIGGYHLAVDAENLEAVRRLRGRKKRDEKPFAVMARSLEEVKRFALVSVEEEKLLSHRSHPIVLLRKRSPEVLAEVAPHNRTVGAMVPYSPLHHLLLREGPCDVLVMTSGNLSDDPIVFTESDARKKLTGIADFFLIHNRKINTRCDDSIRKLMGHGPVTIRRSRGHTPGSIKLDREYPEVLGVGGELKNTFCFIRGDRAFFSHHVGDLKYESGYESFRLGIGHVQNLLRIDRPAAVGYDLHPDYLSTRFALEQTGVERIPVQHHHAHLVSCMAEHRQTGEGIGIVFDGAGFGTDGTIWGGEFLAGGPDGFTRWGTIRPVALPGGDKAVLEPYRVALGILFDLYGERIPDLPIPWLSEISLTRMDLFRRMVSEGINSPLSHGAGRLFDAVSAFLGIRPVASFEGQAAMELEMAVENEGQEEYPSHIDTSTTPMTLDFRPTFERILEELSSGVSPGAISARFHLAVSEGAFRMASAVRKATGLDRVFLSGGVFQNAFLSDHLGASLSANGFEVFRHGEVPPNDGGIALGQAVVAAHRILGRGR